MKSLVFCRGKQKPLVHLALDEIKDAQMPQSRNSDVPLESYCYPPPMAAMYMVPCTVCIYMTCEVKS